MHAAPAQPQPPRVTGLRRRVVLLLSGAAGYLDAVGYLTLGIFTANMTGSTVLLGIFAGHGLWRAAARVALALACFVVGAAAASVLTRRLGRLGGVLAVEAALLAAALAAWAGLLGRPQGLVPEPGAFALIAALCAAMGIQSAAVRRVGEQRLSTTYVTGTLTSLGVDFVADLMTRWRRGRDTEAAPPFPAKGAVALLGGVWGSYLGGAIAGGFAQFAWGFWAVLAPAGALAVVAAWDRRPAGAWDGRPAGAQR